ncbi:hypothetical protein AB0M02_28310 [Actinoplanes sp. NPDC051861]|uniref:hypothetical protein n=1 Tax=Actinoplanes sp. NPDC051861 TaxID=3155170 RepID=UPI0034401A6E
MKILRAALAAVCVLAGSAAPARAAGKPDPLTDAQREVLLEATTKFRDVKKAIKAGYVPTEDCVPGMGLHYVHPMLAADRDIDPVLPEILVYAPPGKGKKPQLVALEYFRADADQNVKTDQDRPTLFGHGFDGPMEGHPVPAGVPPMPVHYDLHVWIYEDNEDGELADLNPEITCER